MGYTFTVADIKRICAAKRLVRQPGSNVWRGIDRGGTPRVVAIHSHGDGDELATGTAKRIAQQLGFRTLAEMHDFLSRL